MPQTAQVPTAAPPPFHVVAGLLDRISDELINLGGCVDVLNLTYDQAQGALVVALSGVAAAAYIGDMLSLSSWLDVANDGVTWRSWVGYVGRATPVRVDIRAVVADGMPELSAQATR